MYPTFTGSAKARRQVNLSGRTNPFAAYGASKPSATTQTSHSAIAHAHQERQHREQERRRPPAAAQIQRLWRGHSSRRKARQLWRKQWDAVEVSDTGVKITGRYEDASAALTQLRLLAQFATAQSDDDLRRIVQFARRWRGPPRLSCSTSDPEWEYPALRISILMIQRIREPSLRKFSDSEIQDLASLLPTLARLSQRFLMNYSDAYYEATVHMVNFRVDPAKVQDVALALLHNADIDTTAAYKGFAWIFLTRSELPGFGEDVDSLSQHVRYEALAASLAKSLPTRTNQHLLQVNEDSDGLLWLLSRFVYFHQHPRKGDGRTTQPDTQYVQVVSRLISALADDIGRRIDNFDIRSFSGNITGQEDNRSVGKPLPSFVHSQILSLVNQQSITGLLGKMEDDRSRQSGSAKSSTEASALASYVLTLLRVFPKRRNDIQLWLFRGSASSRLNTEERLPATKYLYQAAQTTSLFRRIRVDPKQTMAFLLPGRQRSALTDPGLELAEAQDSEWRIILLFLELYSFILQVMDDEEFLSGNNTADRTASWTKQSALPLTDVETLSVFLKNLAFALYWYAAEIAGEPENTNVQGLAAYFGKGEGKLDEQENRKPTTSDEREFAGVSGMTIASLKGLVVGVLRMIYQRDSRRSFLPRNHWLMTRYFEMDRFIAAVVEEEEHGRKIEESFDHNDEESPNSGQTRATQTQIEDSDDDTPLIGTQRSQHIRYMERLKSRQQKASKRKYLESVTPRLQILENMPFFIPFHTRVQIFRQFVELDQIRRRGTSDPDEWRYAQMNSIAGNIGRHRATVRREHIFDDAYKQYYDLGEGLKEPIQIRFVDKFDTVEEGIDGGGVTKEFLTSVTNEAFGAASGRESLFTENDQHLFYPNPTAVEEREESLRQIGFRERSPDWNDVIRDLLRRYEFLGRLIGKCFYEGILIDIHFAPFFLLKWALTGGSGSGAKETGYRANLNDLRDLDDGLYQGLLQLKNYTGNVQDDFSLDFTVTDTLRVSSTENKSVTRDLRPNGSNIPVTNENRLVYIAAVARHRLQSQPFAQTSAFLKGLGTIISPGWLSMFNQSELQTLIGGSGAEVSIADLRANTQYGGVYALGDDGLEHPSIQLFWKVLQNMSPEDVANVLKFVTSTPRAPLLGFANLNPKFSIRDSGGDQSRLPSTSTCVNLLKLPIYKDEKVLREKLLYSVNSGAGFNLS